MELAIIIFVKVINQAGFPQYLAALAFLVLTGMLGSGKFGLFAPIARLAHQISSADNNIQKMSQAYHKRLRFIKAMSRQGGVVACFVSTCATTAKRKHLHEPDIEAAISE